MAGYTWKHLKFFTSKQHLDVFAKLAYEDYTPIKKHVFRAFDLCPWDNVKVVILGQDPYPEKGTANGLAFGVQPHVKRIPPSLQNIFRELDPQLRSNRISSNNTLEGWATQGVLLLNTILTTRCGVRGAHRGYGWERLSSEVIRKLSSSKEGLVFMLWGNFAQGYIPLIDGDKHCIISTSHPSPLSARRGFLGSQCFTRCNEYLEQEAGTVPIDWGRIGM